MDERSLVNSNSDAQAPRLDIDLPMVSAANAVSARAPWPEDGLEDVSACPVCGDGRRKQMYDRLTDRVYGSAPGEWTLYRCMACHSAFLDPRPNGATIGLAYTAYYTHSESRPAEMPGGLIPYFKSALRNGYLEAKYGTQRGPSTSLGRLAVPLVIRWRLAVDLWARHLRVVPEGRLLDIGCGSGGYLAAASSLGWVVSGLDPDPAAVAVARKSGAQVSHGGLPKMDYPDETFDAVTLNHVIEHLHDPLASLKEIHRILKPGGRVWIATPNLDGRGHFEFGRNWMPLDPPRHLVLFTHESLAAACSAAGFSDVIRVRAAFNEQVFYAWSRQLSRGEYLFAPSPPNGRHRRLTNRLGQWATARLKEWATLLFPHRAAEVIVIATRA